MSGSDIATNAPQRIKQVNPSLVIDAGSQQENRIDVIDSLQKEIGVPVMFLDISYGNLPAAYRTLGKLLDCTERAESLATYIESLYKEVASTKLNVHASYKVLFAGNELGLRNNNPVRNQAIKALGAQAIVLPVDEDGDMDIRQIEAQDIDRVVFSTNTCYESIITGLGDPYEIWSSVSAIIRGDYLLCPGLYHNWLNSMVFTQTIGLLWLGCYLWPDVYRYDIFSKTREFYSLFYNHELSDEVIMPLFGR